MIFNLFWWPLRRNAWRARQRRIRVNWRNRDDEVVRSALPICLEEQGTPAHSMDVQPV
jgi:hypothetical protein